MSRSKQNYATKLFLFVKNCLIYKHVNSQLVYSYRLKEKYNMPLLAPEYCIKPFFFSL